MLCVPFFSPGLSDGVAFLLLSSLPSRTNIPPPQLSCVIPFAIKLANFTSSRSLSGSPQLDFSLPLQQTVAHTDHLRSSPVLTVTDQTVLILPFLPSSLDGRETPPSPSCSRRLQP